MASLYWIDEALAGILPTLWMYVGLGMPWALALLPTRRWHSRATVAAVALALGPAWMTAWMLILGVVGAQFNMRLLTVEWILAGSAVIAAGGGFIAGRKRHRFVAKSARRRPLAVDEKLIIAMIAAAVILRWIHTAFWTFTAYDSLWVYGSQGRLYFWEGLIPHSIGYYPQFMQLQYAYVQIAIGGINDHAARMVIPMMHIGSILAAYLLGEGLVNRRVGLFTAALWGLHPLVGERAFRGDLEIPLAFSFTLAVAFFLRAWLGKTAAARRQDGLLAGIMLGIALFTKPTAGALVWGVLLLFGAELWRTRFRIRQWMPRFRVVFWTGLATVPLGCVWYLRNVLLGHEVITLPPEIWLSQARRSGDYLNWIALAVVVGFLICGWRRRVSLKRFAIGIIGILLLLAGVLASNASLFPTRLNPTGSYISRMEAAGIVLGLCLIGWSLRRAVNWRHSRAVIISFWAFLLALPYFATWFYSYSYHYRLGFAITPLLILPTAIALSKGLSLERIRGWLPFQRMGYCGILLLLGLPGIAAVAVDSNWSKVWLLQASLDSPMKKYQAFNPSLVEVVFGLRDDMAESDKPLVVLAPGEQRLPFFFSQMRIIDRLAQDLDEYEALGATHFIYGAKARKAYEQAGIDPAQTQLVAALGRQDLFTKTRSHYDGTFSYELYRSKDMAGRHALPSRRQFPTLHDAKEIVFGDVLRLRAEGMHPPWIFKEAPITLQTAWQALQPMDSDYRFVFELFNRDSQQADYRWVLELGAHRHGYYATSLWDAGETVRELAVVRIPERSEIARSADYAMRLRVFDPISDDYLPVEIDGRPAGDFLTLAGSFRVGRP